MEFTKEKEKSIDRGVTIKSSALSGVRLAVGICGGIGAVEMVKIIREIRRHGATVTPFLTRSVSQFITPLSLEWAAEKKVISELTADVSHLENYDLVLVAPATLNTISKSALGLADNPVTLLIASQIGRGAPLYFVPAMNSVLWGHPAFQSASRTLLSWGAKFFPQTEEEDRIKMPEPAKLTQWIIENYQSQKLATC